MLKKETILKEVLKAIILKNKISLYDMIIEKDLIKEDYNLFVNGILMPDKFGLETKVKDNVQIHLMDKDGI